MGPKIFLAMPDMYGLRPCDQTHLKNSLVPDLYTGGAYDKYPSDMGLVLNYHPFYFLSASQILAGAAEPVSAVILVYSAH